MAEIFSPSNIHRIICVQGVLVLEEVRLYLDTMTSETDDPIDFQLTRIEKDVIVDYRHLLATMRDCPHDAPWGLFYLTILFPLAEGKTQAETWYVARR